MTVLAVLGNVESSEQKENVLKDVESKLNGEKEDSFWGLEEGLLYSPSSSSVGSMCEKTSLPSLR